MMFKELLIERIDNKNTPLCLGIDPHVVNLPPFFENYKKCHGMRTFLKSWALSLIRVASEHLSAVKFQSSFFEALGSDIYSLLPELVQEASQRGLVTILDVKRCDIASTMKAYGWSAFEEIKADAMTVIPYMGLDVFRPLYEWMRKGRGVYSVFLSSNPSGFEKLSASVENKKMVAEHFHEDLFLELKVEGLSEALGIVVGSSSYLKKEMVLKQLSQEFPFLLPGLGFQGGEVSREFLPLISRKSGHLFPVSRSIVALGDFSLVEELSQIESFRSYEEFIFQRVESYKKAFLDLSLEIS
jgi:orotidine-5'-phosphate decarboxylase